MKRAFALAGLIVAWVVAGLVIVPRMIRSAYLEQGTGLLNRLTSGRDVTPLEQYLSAWSSLFVAGSVLVLALTMLVWLVRRFPNQRNRVLRSITGGAPDLTPGTVLWYGTMSCAAGGLIQAVYGGLRHLATQRPAAGFHIELLWMAPLSAGFLGLLLGLVMASMAKLGGTRWHAGRTTAILGFLAIYPVVRSEGIPLAAWAAVLVAAGIASSLGRFAAAHSTTLTRGVRASRPVFLALVLALLAFGRWTHPAVAERRALKSLPTALQPRPNIVLVILDTVRATNLSLYGYGRPTTPELDAWARSGAVFEFAAATAPWTLPTHATVFTGRYNHELETGFQRPLGTGFATLAEVLWAEGYATAGFAANPHYTTDMSGLDRGFQRWEDHLVDLNLFMESSWLAETLTARLRRVSLSHGLKSATEVTDQFLAWVDSRTDRPYFAFLNYFDAHDPYVSPSGFSRFGPLPSEGWDSFMGAWRSDATRRYTQEDAALWVNRYDNAIYYIDWNLGRIRDRLLEDGTLENTIVVITSDHGELWGEHGQLGHAQSLYMPSLHVPLVVSFPGTVPSTRIERPVSLRDVPATILDLAGIVGHVLPGTSAVPVLSGEGDAPLSPLLAELDEDPYNDNPWDPVSRGDMKSLTRNAVHYVRNGDGVEELYDLAVDPGELIDLATDPTMGTQLVSLRLALDSLLTASAPSSRRP